MRFADLLANVALCLLAAGCASVADVPAPAAAPVVATTSASAPVAPAPEVAISAAVQRSFDDAVRALRAGRTADAERAFRALAKSNPELGGSHANLGVIYRQAGKLPEAAAALEQAVRASPQQPLYLNQLGVTYRHQGQFAKAREAYEKAIALDPAYAAPLLNLGILHDLYLGDGPRALELYGRYLALSPGGDAVVTKWVADLKNRKQQVVGLLSRKEKE